MVRGTPPRDGVQRGQLFTALTGRPGSGLAAGGSIRDRLWAAYGANRRGGLDTRAAAADLGVSQRTVQRWIAPEGHQRIASPRPAVARALTAKARQAATTKRGRARAVEAMRRSTLGQQMKRGGGAITVNALQGPGKGPDYQRWRTVTIPTTTFDGTNHIERLWAAYADGGDDAARAVINDLAQDYCAGWQFGEVDDFGIGQNRF